MDLLPCLRAFLSFFTPPPVAADSDYESVLNFLFLNTLLKHKETIKSLLPLLLS